MPSRLDEIETEHYTISPIENFYPEIEQLYEKAKKGSVDRARTAFLLALYFDTRDHEKSLTFLTEANRLSIKLSDAKILSDTQHYLAIEAYKLKNVAKFYRLSEEALANAKAANHSFRIAHTNLTLGVVAQRQGSSDSAIQYLESGLRIAFEFGFQRLKLRLFRELAELHLFPPGLGKAKNYANQAVEIAELIGADGDVLTAKVRLATIELERKEFERVVALVGEVRSVLPKSNKALWCNTHTLLGEVHASKRRWAKADEEFRAALKLADYSDRVRSNIHNIRSLLFLKTKEYAVALKEA